MARMKPDSFDYSQTESNGEERVYDSLKKNLCDDWLICHSWRWLKHPNNKKTYKKQGEGDFVLFHPSCGIIVIEVKGGTIEYRENGKYYANNILIQNPEKQASDTKFEIKARLKERNLEDNVYVSHAVWFPDIIWNIDYPPNLNSQILFDKNDLTNPENKLRKLTSGNIIPIKDNKAIQIVEKMLFNSFKLVKSLKFSIQDTMTEMVRLNQQQINALEYLDEQHCIGVKGRAGTGKTLLAVYKAKQLSESGKKVLFLCFNRSLADWLSAELSGTNISVFTYHKYASDYLHKYKPWRIPDTSEESKGYFDHIGNEFSEVISENADEFDCCIIDEAQDLKPEWFTEIKNAFYPELHFYFFFDPLQIPYTRKIVLQEKHFSFGALIIPLYKNMRNTKQVSQSAWNVLRESYNEHKHFNSIDGDYPEVNLCEDEVADKVYQKIMLLINLEGISRESITILSMGNGTESKIGKQIYDIPVIPFRKFKGLENDIVLLIDVNYQHFHDPVFQRELYVAMTRSRFYTILFINNKDTIMKKAYLRYLGVENISQQIIEDQLKKNNYE